jgi:hypothetical protein
MVKTTKKPGQKALELLVQELYGSSGVETSRGTKALWGQLERAGLVKKMPYGGFLGHPFFFNITDDGRAMIRQLKSFKVEVIADASGQWTGNALRFESKLAAEVYAKDLFSRWTAVKEWRVVETKDPVTEVSK